MLFQLNNRNLLDMVQWKVLRKLTNLPSIVRMKICHDHIIAIDYHGRLCLVREDDIHFEPPTNDFEPEDVDMLSRPGSSISFNQDTTEQPFEMYEFASNEIVDVVSNRIEMAILLDDGKVYRSFWAKLDPFHVTYLSNIEMIKMGEDIFLALNDLGQVFSLTPGNVGKPTVMTIGHETKRIINIEVGKNHAVAITEDWRPYAWGVNNYYQLGIGNIIDQKTPQEVLLPENVRVYSVACSSLATLYLSNTGIIYFCGNGKANYSKPSPIRIQGCPEVSNIFAINYFGYVQQEKNDESLLVCCYNDEKVFVWGNSKDYERVVPRPTYSGLTVLQTMTQHSKYRGYPFLAKCRFDI